MLELRGVSKSFPGVKALDNVSITFHPGEVHALLGENGAGKSTLIKIICGLYQPDEGEVILNGKKVHFASFRDALESEISIVNQEIQVIPQYSIAENIFIDKISKFANAGIINWKQINAEAAKYLKMVGLDMDPTTIISGLSAAQKQLIQIAKALSSNAKVLLLDEPTSSLTKHEALKLFTLVTKLRNQGVVLIFVSHKLEEVLSLSDKVSVLRDGKYVGTKDRINLTKQDIVKMMIGRETKDHYLGQLDINQSNKVLEVKNLTQAGRFNNINLDLHEGEILGFYGLVGSGRTELAKILIGEDTMDAGEVVIGGKKASIKSMADSLYKYRLGYVSENRKEEGLILEESVKTNIGITIWSKIVQPMIRKISLKSEESAAQQMIKALNIKVTGPDDIVGGLSGGNQQKVSIAKWLAAGCDILIIDEPSVGVDVGAKEYIHQLIWNLAKVEKKSIIVISSDLPELCTLARRILVFREFQIVGELNDINDRPYSYEELSDRIGQYLA
ncbi:ATP-binding cassette domain-containing protein [Paenibacillus sp. LMG 31460]|uniref:ATP-binding cassette domain-containing protein n=1 Tax=Paenibacillus germinis TaxID=2654979 RepID=A0ABX1Z5R6_9BACL|nr:sugar ABC transporter ATP-binding protein [Paenibacillus germinis]NOU88723.1 ATP-binding cassette domain-containing protein [Paenibacillus germinis]